MNVINKTVQARSCDEFISPEARELIANSTQAFLSASPFNYLVVDDFFELDVADQLSSEFPDYESSRWYFYNNSIENKKALNNWNEFPALTYKVLTELNRDASLDLFTRLTSTPLFRDQGLHGGGWHIHGPGGNLNPHLDYSIHPKLGLQRKVNIIIYLSREMKPEYGGHLGLWSHDEVRGAPAELVREVEPRFNRAIIFDTTQNSWHGMSRPLIQPDGIYRKSLAVYYLCEPQEGADPRGRALFAAREEQVGDPEIESLIRARADVELSRTVYKS